MIVSQLIEALKLVEDQALEVYAEGCDCEEPAFGVALVSNENGVYCLVARERKFQLKSVLAERRYIHYDEIKV